MRAKHVVTVPVQPYFGLQMNPTEGIPHKFKAELGSPDFRYWYSLSFPSITLVQSGFHPRCFAMSIAVLNALSYHS